MSTQTIDDDGAVQAPSTVADTVPHPTLHVPDGPDAGRVHQVLASSITVGRRQGNDVRLTDRGVSRVHARLTRQGGAVVLTDLNSTAGTTVNGRTIEGPVVLAHGDRVGFGPSELVFEDPSALGVIEEVTQVDLGPGEIPSPTLSPRQREIVQLMADGESNAEIAERLGLTHRTVKSYASEIYARLGTPNRAGAVATAIRHDLL